MLHVIQCVAHVLRCPLGHLSGQILHLGSAVEESHKRFRSTAFLGALAGFHALCMIRCPLGTELSRWFSRRELSLGRNLLSVV